MKFCRQTALLIREHASAEVYRHCEGRGAEFVSLIWANVCWRYTVYFGFVYSVYARNLRTVEWSVGVTVDTLDARRNAGRSLFEVCLIVV